MRPTLVLVTFALIAASCSGSNEPAAAPTPAAAPGTTASSDVGSTSSSVVQPTTEASGSQVPISAAATPSFDGPPAPDFELALSDGSTFRLSDEENPVYIVFWAEW